MNWAEVKKNEHERLFEKLHMGVDFGNPGFLGGFVRFSSTVSTLQNCGKEIICAAFW